MTTTVENYGSTEVHTYDTGAIEMRRHTKHGGPDSQDRCRFNRGDKDSIKQALGYVGGTKKELALILEVYGN